MFFRVFPGFSGFPGFFSGFFRFHPVALVEPDVLKKTRPPSDYRFKSCARLKKWPKSGQKRGKKFENSKKKKTFGKMIGRTWRIQDLMSWTISGRKIFSVVKYTCFLLAS